VNENKRYGDVEDQVCQGCSGEVNSGRKTGSSEADPTNSESHNAVDYGTPKSLIYMRPTTIIK